MLLLRAFDGPITSALSAERASSYVTILHALLLLRRGHELEPLHEDLLGVARPALLALSEEWDVSHFATDLAQLERWGCVARRAEALKIRSYKDARRERFRYRLTEDAVAMLEWLELRLAARLEGRTRDSRDVLTDVLGQLKEAKRVLDAWKAGERDDTTARRAVHLLTVVDDSVHALTEELLSFRAGMLSFVSRRYDVGVLREILDFLDRYVSVYLTGVEALRGEIDQRLTVLGKPRYRHALAECQEALFAERLRTPAALRGAGRVRSTDDLLDAQLPFFAARGHLQQLCDRIDASARSVLRKMQRHLRELERRSARLEDLRGAMARIARLDPDREHAELGALMTGLVASGHARFPSRRPPAGERVAPPMPRSHKGPSDGRARTRPLRPKRRSPEEVRELRAARLADLRTWMEEHVLSGSDRVRLADVCRAGGLSDVDAPGRWMAVARARYLARGVGLGGVGVRIDAVAGAPATLGDSALGLEVPDCVVSRSTEP